VYSYSPSAVTVNEAVQASLSRKDSGTSVHTSDGGAGPAEGRPAVRVSVSLQPRDGSLTELNVIGNTVDDAIARLEKFLDESTVTDIHELRIVHGHGTGQLRRAIAAFLKEHPLVAKFESAPQNQGGGGATIVELKD
jgi:DNA mismatch repair protein MutS2